MNTWRDPVFELDALACRRVACILETWLAWLEWLLRCAVLRSSRWVDLLTPLSIRSPPVRPWIMISKPAVKTYPVLDTASTDINTFEDPRMVKGGTVPLSRELVIVREIL